MSRLRLQLLGTPLAWCDDAPVHFKTRKTRAVLAYLAAEGGLQPRDYLAGLLWPATPGSDARTHLRVALGFLRQALGEWAFTTTRDAVGLNVSTPTSLSLDLQAVRQARQLARSLDGAPGLRTQLESAAALYRGPFLDGLDVPGVPEFETWLAGQRAHWLGVTLELLERLAEWQADAGEVAATQATLERWVALEPGEERAWERLLTLIVERGDLVGARRTWTMCQRALADLGVAPGPALQALAAQIGAASRAVHPAPHSAGPSPGVITWGPLGEAPLVGRTGSLATLRQVFARAQTGRAQIAVLQGEAGIGKTRLAREFSVWARAQGADVLTGRALEAETGLPYAPLVDALRPCLERENAPDDLLADLWLAELAQLLPELRERYPDLPTDALHPTLGKGRLFEAAARLGQALAARRPLVLVVDDLQWADGETRDLLRYALRRWAEGVSRTLVLLAVRAEDVATQQSLGHWLSSLEREAPTTRLELEYLKPPDVVQLVEALGGREEEGAGPSADEAVQRGGPAVALGQWLVGRTGGQPSHVVQMLRAMVEQGAVALRPTPGGGWALSVTVSLDASQEQWNELLPAGVRTLIRARLARLDEMEEEVLAAGTVLGGSFTASRVCQVAEVDERSGIRVLDHLVRERLLREVPSAGGYAVCQQLVRDVLYAEMGEARRRRLHRRAMVVLEEERALTAEVALHALAAGLIVPAARHGLGSGDLALAALAVREALTQYERTRTLVDAAGPKASNPMVAADLAECLEVRWSSPNERRWAENTRNPSA